MSICPMCKKEIQELGFEGDDGVEYCRVCVNATMPMAVMIKRMYQPAIEKGAAIYMSMIKTKNEEQKQLDDHGHGIFCTKCKTPMRGHNQVEKDGVLYDKYWCLHCKDEVYVVNKEDCQ